MRPVFIALAACLAGPATAQVANPCDWEARADAIVEPWEDHTATFANGAIRVALLDVTEPAAASYFLLVLHPPTDELGLRTCTTVSLDDGLGYAFIDFAALDAAYDPALGLTLNVPAIIYLPEQSFQNSALLKIIVNQSTGEVAVSQRLGNE